MKRLLVYCFYDTNGIVDDFVTYFLDKMQKYCSQIIIVVNGKLEVNSKNILQKYSNNVILRENKGFDSGAFKDVVEKFGFEYLKEFDEVIFANSTFYGPIFELDTMFNKMESNQDIDFWGVTKHSDLGYQMAGKTIGAHIQSYFLAYKKSILNSPIFKEYWDNVKIPTNYEEAVKNYELFTTEFFESKGFKSASYIENCNIPSGEASFYNTNELVKNHNLPFIKRKIFYTEKNSIKSYIKDGAVELINFIQNNTSYNINLIYNDIKRNYFKDVNPKNYLKNYLKLVLKQIILPWQWKHYSKKKKNLKHTMEILKKINYELLHQHS